MGGLEFRSLWALGCFRVWDVGFRLEDHGAGFGVGATVDGSGCRGD